MKIEVKKAGIFAFTGCEGCQLQILDLLDSLLQMLEFVDIEYFKLAEERNVMEKFDIAIVEGGISNEKELEILKKVRANSKFLIAMGECAVSGGVPALRNIANGRAYAPKRMYPKTYGIDKYIKVDFRLRGCPIEGKEFLSLIDGLVVGKIPQEVNHPVCMECVSREIECLMLKGMPCMGPVTCAGCNARCPAKGTACEGCRGLTKDAGVKQLVDKFREMGLSNRMVKNMLDRFSLNDIEAEKRGKTCMTLR